MVSQPKARGLGSTYRLQLSGFGFERARQLVGYLHSLGVEVLYVSPVLSAVPGSTHGYDVADATHVDPALGGADGLEALLAELADHGMTLLIDVVSNHLAASTANPWWWDVLRLGRASPYARYFDIEWAAQAGRVLLPVLASPLGDVLDAGQLSLLDQAGPQVLAYGEQQFPLDPATVEPAGRRPADLPALLQRQHYRLAYWRLGHSEGNYRRFFDVDGLVGMRVEDPAVYSATHAVVLELAADQRVAGLRVDHIDGLADPAAYLDRLRVDLDRVRATPAVLLVEKILARGEALPSAWPVEGTTGYEFSDLAVGVLVDGAGAAALARSAAVETGVAERPFLAVVDEAKAEVAASLFRAQVERLARRALDALSTEGRTVDLALADMVHAVSALTVALPVYRTYLDGGPPERGDRHRVTEAAARASVTLDIEGRRALDLLCQGMLVSGPDDFGGVARRWQQLSGAVAAKGVEDTALYRFDGLLVAADVGADPGQPAVAPEEFHRAMAVRARDWPGSLNATATHDSKRGDDVRARLAVLSEIPERWSALVRRWRRRHRALVSGLGGAPTPHDELFVYQSVVGTWPPEARGRRAYVARLQEYAVKAAREAKHHTSWLDPDPRYERALRRFVADLLEPAGGVFSTTCPAWSGSSGPPPPRTPSPWWCCAARPPESPTSTRARSCGRGTWSIPTTGDRSTSPGGATSWPSSTPPPRAIAPAGRPTAQAMGGRADQALRDEPTPPPATPPAGAVRPLSYHPLAVDGPRAQEALAFLRSAPGERACVIVPRLPFSVAGPGRFPTGRIRWSATTLTLPSHGPRRWTDVLTGASVTPDRAGRLAVGETLATLPVAVLVAE